MIPSDLALVLFKSNCRQSGGKNTGTYHCPFNMLRTRTLIFTPAGFVFTETLSQAYVNTLQLQGNAVVLSKVTKVEDLTAQDNIVTDTGSNIKTKAGSSPYEYAFTFRNGWYFDSAIRQLESFGAYDVTYLDDAYNVIFTANATDSKGISCGQIAVDPIKNSDGAETGFSRLWFQELYRTERDSELAWITQPNHNLRPAALDGINDILIEFDPNTIPGAGDTSVVFSVKTAPDVKDVDLGLLLANYQFTKAGNVVAFSALPTQNTTTKLWTGLLAVALVEGQALSLRAYDSAYTTGNFKKGSRIYHTNTDTVTVVA